MAGGDPGFEGADGGVGQHGSALGHDGEAVAGAEAVDEQAVGGVAAAGEVAAEAAALEAGVGREVEVAEGRRAAVADLRTSERVNARDICRIGDALSDHMDRG